MEKKNFINFEKKIETIFELIMGYGIKSLYMSEGGKEKVIHEMRNQIEKNRTNSKLWSKLTEKVHEGWSIAQDKIYHELLSLSKKRKILKRKLKEARVTKDKKSINEKIKSLKFLSYQEKVYRKLADTIAWQMLGLQDYIVRRFYIRLGMHSIDNLNPSEKEFVDNYNKNNKKSFALMADLTTFFQVGDVLIIDKLQEKTIIKIIELKEGVVNEKIRQTLDNWYETRGCPAFLKFFKEDYGEKHLEHLMRMAKQDYRGFMVKESIEKERFKLPSGETLIIPEKIYNPEHFDVEFNDLLKEADEKNWAIGIIDNCLYVGVYTTKYLPRESAFYAWIRGSGIKYPIINFISCLSDPASYPPFLLPIPKKDIIEIVTGKKFILYCLDFDNLFKLGEKIDLKMYWLNRKESSKIIQNSEPRYRVFEYDHKCIQFEYNNRSSLFGGGLLIRIFFKFVRPFSVIQISKDNLTSRHYSENFAKNSKKIGRNEPCPCGSGFKYKKCCGKLPKN